MGNHKFEPSWAFVTGFCLKSKPNKKLKKIKPKARNLELYIKSLISLLVTKFSGCPVCSVSLKNRFVISARNPDACLLSQPPPSIPPLTHSFLDCWLLAPAVEGWPGLAPVGSEVAHFRLPHFLTSDPSADPACGCSGGLSRTWRKCCLSPLSPPR